MHRYRTHTCGALRHGDLDASVRLSGWVHRKRDLGNLLFVDLRDHHGHTQLVVERDHAAFAALEAVRVESTICVDGRVVARAPDQINAAMPTGEVEVAVTAVEVLGACDVLPMQVAGTQEYPEEIRLRHRYLDLRRERVHQNIVLRSRVIASLRRRMIEQGFLEIQTPILTASSPEGARDYLVPSRVHPGKFYALPQAPQIFKQLLMVSGFDRYFQIAPCFRDEDARADRSPGEFYQLDVELAYVTQDDVFAAIEPVLHGVFEELSPATTRVTAPPFPRITYHDAMRRFGTDKPDLRNPLEMIDATAHFAGGGFRTFASAIAGGAEVRALRVPGVATRPRSFFDGVVEHARRAGAAGLAYVVLAEPPKGPLAKFLDATQLAALAAACGAGPGDAIACLCDTLAVLARAGHAVRTWLGEQLGLIEPDTFRMCWIVDFPMFERDPDTGAIGFSHNPFSMPQGGLDALRTQDPLDVRAFQYDIVCNGVELSSGAIRNHRPDVMLAAFAIAGHDEASVRERFSGLFNAFRYGAPPHGGLAPGVDRMVMLLAGEANIREVIAFPMAQNAQDLMMNAPAEVSERQLRELHLTLREPPAR
ncbi:MAG: aspartate--tRNA ligase [Kofleriaceae bacterium]|nr:aspartate--tRNA ligase [Myxococcales bacterium]MCB9561758.1 aspartate--tRNA ligase [Kofleriaceae bacterium]MCB9573693.1 aspartate--tRNA ligase [Kofleriaceae bacterium]